MDKNNFGNIVKHIRKKRNITIKELSHLSTISVRQIHRIEVSNVPEGNFYTIHRLSKALKVNLMEYSIIFSEFDTFEEYETYSKLRYSIETRNFQDLYHILDKYNLDDICNRSFCLFTQILYYSYAIKIAKTYQDFENSLDLCYRALNTTKENFDIYNLKLYLDNELSYAIVSQIEAYNFFLDNFSTSRNIACEMIKIIEDMYYDSDLPYIRVPTVILRTYIVELNNNADNLFFDGEYNLSLSNCEKAIKILKSSNSNYLLNKLYFLMCENYYCLGDIDTSNKFLYKAVASCISCEKNDYIEDTIKPKIKKLYPLLAIPSAL